MKRLTDLLGIGHGGERYQYGLEDRFGPTHVDRIPDEWVRTTCGYCSVGCGILIGTKDGRAVATKGDPDHPVNRGRLCPKGLSEHLTIGAPGRLTVLMGWGTFCFRNSTAQSCRAGTSRIEKALSQT